VAGPEGQERRVCGRGLRIGEGRGLRQEGRGANLCAFGNWKTWWRTRVRTRSLPLVVGDVSGMWDPRLVRLALVQQLRAVYGIKVKGCREQCDRRRREPAAAETGVSSVKGDLGLQTAGEAHPAPTRSWYN
jgi:hypothetical protein